MTIATPAKAPHPVADFLAPAGEDLSAAGIATAELATSTPCCLPVQVGLSFDGVNHCQGGAFRHSTALRLAR